MQNRKENLIKIILNEETYTGGKHPITKWIISELRFQLFVLSIDEVISATFQHIISSFNFTIYLELLIFVVGNMGNV